MKSIKVKPTSFYLRIADYIMMPLMWLVLGFKLQLPQETHKWHIQNIDCEAIDDQRTVVIKTGVSDTWWYKVPSPLFGALMHATIFGGWKDYIIIEAKNFGRFWNVGWKVYRNAKDRPHKCEVQKLRICNNRIKLLRGGSEVFKIFGLDEDGKQIDVNLVGEGRLGDHKFKGVRLF